ncbi:MAG TPA: hypothetical protein VMX55_15215 [candidate division Zixibacteria bacterium]|nr:hypothetical protein [candidate division Zixibacteria bacterium]
MSLLQKYRKEETRKTTPEEEKGIKSDTTLTETKTTISEKSQAVKQPIAPKEPIKKSKKITGNKTPGIRSRPVISATVSLDLVDALNTLTEEKYLNRSKFIEDALIRTIKTEFPEIAKRYDI